MTSRQLDLRSAERLVLREIQSAMMVKALGLNDVAEERKRREKKRPPTSEVQERSSLRKPLDLANRRSLVIFKDAVSKEFWGWKPRTTGSWK